MRAVGPVLVSGLLLFCSCSKTVTGSAPDRTSVGNFEMLWQEFDRFYSHFEVKHVDWDSVYAVYRPQVTERTAEKELFEILSKMLETLKDTHVSLSTPYGEYRYEGWRRSAVNFDSRIVTYYLKSRMGGGSVSFGDLGGDLGYIHISSFGGEGGASGIDQALDRFRDLRGIVVDVRDNGGGNDQNSDYVASRFADQRRLYGYVRWRNGPNHSDFTGPIGRYAEPSSKWRYTGPVAVLTNRRCFSATEMFVLAMKVLPHVVVVGDTTGGGTGNPINRELPNGWVYKIPRWIQLTPEMTIIEDVGLAPDFPVSISKSDSDGGRDTILEEAIRLLGERVAAGRG